MTQIRFDGSSVIVTGGGRGIGRSHALLLASRGARVVVADSGAQMNGDGSSPVPADEVVKEIKAAGGEAVACYASVTEEAGAASVAQTALGAFGRLDAVINNAGISEWAGTGKCHAYLGLPSSMAKPFGILIRKCRSVGPASRSRTRIFGSSESRFASAHPADPAPATM